MRLAPLAGDCTAIREARLGVGQDLFVSRASARSKGPEADKNNSRWWPFCWASLPFVTMVSASSSFPHTASADHLFVTSMVLSSPLRSISLL